MEDSKEKYVESFRKKMLSFGPNIFIYKSEYDKFVNETLTEREIFRRDRRKKATPVALSMANKLGYRIKDINGTGVNGRVVKVDVENYKPKSWR